MIFSGKLLLLLVLSITSLLSCIYGPETELKKASDIFNRKNYEAPVPGVPVLKAKKRNTIIEGIVRNSDYTPFKFQKVILLNKMGTEVSEATTSSKGAFKFMDIIENGDYLIKTESKCCSGEIEITVDDYQIDNIILDVKPDKSLNQDE